jgi:calcineurin-like phosphoesterase family protein
MSSAMKEEVINMIQNLDQKGVDLLYIIIMIFAKRNQTRTIQEALENNKVIFKGKKDVNDDMTCNFKWNFNDFPTKLKHIINKFLIMHLATMVEEKDRSNTKEQYDTKN